MFRTTSNKLLKDLFVYLKMRRILIPKKMRSTETRPLTLTFPRIKIIEKSILNVLEPVFKSKFNWKCINKSEYGFSKTDNKKISVASN